jgi:putative endopeptidase
MCGGVRLTYIAFLADAKRKGLDPGQRQDDCTPVQQYFLGYGQDWCGATRLEQRRLQVANRSALVVCGVKPTWHPFAL